MAWVFNQPNYIRANSIWIGWCNWFKENLDDQQKYKSIYLKKVRRFSLKKY